MAFPMDAQRFPSHLASMSRVLHFSFEPLIFWGTKLAVAGHLMKGCGHVRIVLDCHVVRRPKSITFGARHWEMIACDGSGFDRKLTLKLPMLKLSHYHGQ